MRAIRSTLVAAGLILVSQTSLGAQTTTLNFNDGTANASVGAFYSAQGVTFLNATWQNPFGCCGVASTSNGYQPQPSNPITAVFMFALASLSLEGQDVGSQGFLLNAYDATLGGNLIASSFFTGVGLGVGTNHTLTVAASNIWRVEFSQQNAGNGSEGLIFDDMTYTADAVTATPEPASMVLLATGLAGVFTVTRRRRKVA